MGRKPSMLAVGSTSDLRNNVGLWRKPVAWYRHQYVVIRRN